MILNEIYPSLEDKVSSHIFGERQSCPFIFKDFTHFRQVCAYKSRNKLMEAYETIVILVRTFYFSFTVNFFYF